MKNPLSEKDTTEKKLVQDFFYNARSINFISDLEGNIILANKQTEKLFGFDETKIRAKNMADLLKSTVPGFVKNHLRASLKNPTAYISVFDLPARNKKEYKITTQLSSDKKHFYHSILELSGTELEIAKSLYQTMAEYSSDAITVIADHKFAYVSPAANKIFGFSPEEILGEPREAYYLRIHEDDAPEFYKRIDESLAKKEKFQNYSYRFKTKDGKIKWIEDFVQRKFDKQGNEIMAIINSRDITARKKTEAELKAANAAKDKFFSIIAHDLKSPFNALIGFSELLITQNDISEEKKNVFLNHIYQSAKTTFTLLENLLMWSRVQTDRITYEPVKFNIKDVVKQNLTIIRGSAENKQIKLINKVKQNQYVFADLNMINTVLRNLLSNAVKFTARKGSISVSLRQLRGDYIKLSVQDTGIGMTQDSINKVLKIDQSFTTSGTEKEKGSGLGLILCNEFVQINGGKMSISSELNKGSKFSVSLRTRAEE